MRFHVPNPAISLAAAFRALAVFLLLTFLTPLTSPAQEFYEVQPGDSLWKIANQHGLSVEQIRSLNNLESDVIRPGQKLRVKGSAGGAPQEQTGQNGSSSQASSQPGPAPSGVLQDEAVARMAQAPQLVEYLYVIQPGDSLNVIAKKFNATVRDIKWLNDLVSDEIFVDGQLLVPTTNPPEGVAEMRYSGHNSAASEEIRYTVKRGDSLSTIAQEHDTSITRIRWRNGMQSSTPRIGQELILPVGSKGGDTSTATVEQAEEDLEPAAGQVPDGGVAPPPVTQKIPGEINEDAVEEMAQSVGLWETLHRVESGDSMESIAQRYGSSAPAIRWLNARSDDELAEVEVLLVPTYSPPDGSRQLALNQLAPVDSAEVKEVQYEIKPGDSLAELAAKYGTTLTRLRWRNELSSNTIRVGETLIIPATRTPEGS